MVFEEIPLRGPIGKTGAEGFTPFVVIPLEMSKVSAQDRFCSNPSCHLPTDHRIQDPGARDGMGMACGVAGEQDVSKDGLRWNRAWNNSCCFANDLDGGHSSQVPQEA